MIAVDSPPKQVFIYPPQVLQTPLPLVEKIPGTTPGLLHSPHAAEIRNRIEYFVKVARVLVSGHAIKLVAAIHCRIASRSPREEARRVFASSWSDGRQKAKTGCDGNR